MKNLLSIFSLLICITCLGATHKDTIYKSQKLKGGYTFALKRHDSIKYACLIKEARPDDPFGRGKEIEVVDDEGDTNMPLSSLGYVYADYDKVFVLATHDEANPIQIQVIDKNTGGDVIYGATPFYTDTVKNIMMFEGNHRRAGKLILYDFNTGKSELFIAPKETPCFCCFCWKVISLTDAELKIEYLNMKYEKVVQTYARK
jgi:hypothetical protein